MIMANKENKIARLAIDDRCEGCNNIAATEEGNFCSKYADPAFHWEGDQICAFATHVKREVKVNAKKLNPLKASKRSQGHK